MTVYQIGLLLYPLDLLRASRGALAALGLAACSSAPAASSADFAADAWAASALEDAPYLLAPGDKIEVIVHTALTLI